MEGKGTEKRNWGVGRKENGRRKGEEAVGDGVPSDFSTALTATVVKAYVVFIRA